MIRVSAENLAKFKKLCDEHNIHYDTEQEYYESAYSLLRLIKVILKDKS